MTKLTDTQCVLLSTAAKRETLSLYPLPEGLKPKGGLAKAMSPLSERLLIEERETTISAEVYRTDGDYRFGLFATPAGLTAIGIDCGNEVAVATEKIVTAPKVERKSKASAVLGLLRREEGATLAELVAATGWLPHTTRAALTGIKKKGHVVERAKRDDASCYFIRAAA